MAMHSCVDSINWITLEQIKEESGKVVIVTLNGICVMSWLIELHIKTSVGHAGKLACLL